MGKLTNWGTECKSRVRGTSKDALVRGEDNSFLGTQKGKGLKKQ